VSASAEPVRPLGQRRVQSLPARLTPALAPAACAGLVLAGAALLGRLGADGQWLAALGRSIASQHAVPAGLPFADGSTAHWPNPLVAAELIFAGLQAFGDRGLMLAQLVAVGGALYVLASDARAQGAGLHGMGAVLLLVGFGSLPSLAIARVQLFSLLLFPVLLALLRSQTRAPSARIWLAVPLLAVWSNLHGVALLGLATLVVYLAAERARRQPLLSAGVGLAGAGALCLTPAGLRTVAYYHGLLTNVAAQRGTGLWGPLSLSSPLDVVLVLCALALIVFAWRARPALWEVVLAAGLAVLTIKADRDGVWLLFLLATPAARAINPTRSISTLAPGAAILAVLGLGLALARGPVPTGAGPALVRQAVTLAHGSPILADSPIDEQVALGGGDIWAGDPLDAFPPSRQASYLAWLNGSSGGRRALTEQIQVVVVSRAGAAARLMRSTPGFVVAGSDADALLFRRQA
jgi:hypothetical protein